MGKLTDDDFDVIDGRREQLLGKLQERQAWPAKRLKSRSATGKPATQPSVSTTDLFSPFGGAFAALVHPHPLNIEEKTMKFTRTLIALSAATLMATSAMAMEPAEYKAANDQISPTTRQQQAKM